MLVFGGARDALTHALFNHFFGKASTSHNCLHLPGNLTKMSGSTYKNSAREQGHKEIQSRFLQFGHLGIILVMNLPETHALSRIYMFQIDNSKLLNGT